MFQVSELRILGFKVCLGGVEFRISGLMVELVQLVLCLRLRPVAT